jgi:hypothetical protein
MAHVLCHFLIQRAKLLAVHVNFWGILKNKLPTGAHGHSVFAKWCCCFFFFVGCPLIPKGYLLDTQVCVGYHKKTLKKSEFRVRFVCFVKPSTMSFTGIGLMLGSCLARGPYSDKAPGLRLFTLHLLICMFKNFSPTQVYSLFLFGREKDKTPLPLRFPNLYFVRKMVRKVKFWDKSL